LPSGGESGLAGWPSTAGPSGIPLALTQTEICVAESAKWLQTHVGQHLDRPFFLSVHFDKPHFPVNPPRSYFDRYSGKVRFPELPGDLAERHVPFVRAANSGFLGEGTYHQGDEDSLKLLASYYGCVEWIDDAMGRILSVLDYLGMSEDTIVVYSSDHGEMAGEHGCWQKTKFYDAAARVPLIIKWPKVVPQGSRIDDLVGLVDLFPSLCDLSGLDIPEQCDGLSLKSSLTKGDSLDREAVFAESVVLKHPEHAGCMIRTGDWKFNYYLDGHHELYNLAEDPNEFENRVNDPSHSDLVRDLSKKIEDFWEPDKQVGRYNGAPRMSREKHFYEFSNQFVLGNGQVVDGRP
jgi:choline-sulfatase